MIFLTYPLATGKGAKPTLQDLEYIISPPFSAMTTIKTTGFSSDFLDHEFPFIPFLFSFCFFFLASHFTTIWRWKNSKVWHTRSPAGVFRGARISSLETPAGEASILGDIHCTGLVTEYLSHDSQPKLSFPWIYIIQWNLDITNLYKKNEVLGMMNIFFTQRIVKYMEKNLDIRKPR